jgi:hypothetical protein
MSLSREKVPATDWQRLIQETDVAANHLIDAVQQVLAYDACDLVHDERVALADQLADLGFVEFARKIAPVPDCVRDLERFDAAHKAYPEEALRGTTRASPEVVGELRAASDTVMKSKPRCRLELGRKVKVACVVGLYKKIRNACGRPDPYAANLYSHFWPQLVPIEPWVLAMEVGYQSSIGDSEFSGRAGNFIADPSLIEELLECAGPEWRGAIAADLAALNSVLAKPKGGAVL